MDKELKRFMKGRLSIAVVIAVCLLVLALPALAFAANTNAFPVNGSTLYSQPTVVGVTFWGSALDARPGKSLIKVDGTALSTVAEASSVGGHWNLTESLVGGVWWPHWTWTAASALAGQVKVYAFPAALLAGPHTVTAKIQTTDGSIEPTATWSFTTSIPPAPPVTPPTGPTGVAGCDCHKGYQKKPAMGPNCNACHSGLDTPAHGNPFVGGVSVPAGAHDALAAALTQNSPGCVSCHGNDVTHVLAANWDGKGAVSEHKGCSCHIYGEADASKTSCESCHVKPLDPTAPYPYHVGAHDTVQSEIAANSAGCVSCHGSDLLSVLNPTTMTAGGPGEHKSCSCHAYHEADGKMACEDCHIKPLDPSAPYPYHVGAHNAVQAGIAGTKSSACTTCHGTDLLHVTAGPMTTGAHSNCVCHRRHVADGATECVSCHKDGDAAHGFVNGLAHTGGGWIPASGHNTLTYGAIGAKTNWAGTGITDSNGSTITTSWALPTVNVFKAGALDQNGHQMDWNSTITCQGCHTHLDSVGPHGAAANWDIDPAFTADYKEAALDAESPVGMTVLESVPGTVALSPDGEEGDNIICSKCHDLVNDNNMGTVMSTVPGRGWSNTGHSSHHAEGTNTKWGQGDCVACHLAVPHGWKRPRLLVYASDGLAYFGKTRPATAANGVVMDYGPTAVDGPLSLIASGTPAPVTSLDGFNAISSTAGHSLNSSGGAVWSGSSGQDCQACLTASNHHLNTPGTAAGRAGAGNWK